MNFVHCEAVDLTHLAGRHRGELVAGNAAHQGAFVDLARGFFRVLGQVKMSVLLGFTLAAYNLDRVRSFRAKQAQYEENPRRRARRRQGTWSDLVTAPRSVATERSTGPPD